MKLSLCILLAVCSVSFALEWSRLNPHVVENGAFIEKNGTHYSISNPSGHAEHYSFSDFDCAHCGHRSHHPSAADSGSGNGKRDSSATGWVASFWSWGNNYTYISSQWTVPTAPRGNSGQILFYFNSFEGATNGGSGADILQPVLQFNNIIGGWSLASWYGDSNGYVHSSAIAVKTGDTITGVITLANGVWFIYGYVNGVLTTNLTVAQSTFAGGDKQNTAQWVLEVYSVPNCTYYPPENFLTMSEIIIKDSGVLVANPSWSVPSTYAAACNAAGYTAPSTATTSASNSSKSLTITWQSGNAIIGTAKAIASVGVDISEASNTLCVGPVSEGSTVSLACSNDQVITSVSFASYGTPSGSCGSFAKSTCDASNSLAYLQAQCLNKSSCSFTASNTNFGDPCVGTLKHFDAQVVCSSNFGLVTATSALACASACDVYANCVGWVWDSKSTCNLKSSVGTRTASSSVVSGVKQGEVGFDRTGINLPGYPITLPSGSTASTCAAYCNGNAACQAWSYDTCGTSCYLKGAPGTRSASSCRTSGVKGVQYADHVGSDLSSSVLANSADTTQCANLCASTSGCTNWAYVLPGAGCETANTCWLKKASGSGVPAESVNKCRVVGVVH